MASRRSLQVRWSNTLMTALVVLALFHAGCGGDFQAGWEALERGDFETALREWRPLAEQGDPKAQYALGFMYANGEGVPKNDAEAVKWFRKAAEQGDPNAQDALGLMYANGEGVPKNDVEAAKWLRKAAEQGDPEAQYNLGAMYANGRGVPKNDVEAYAWFSIAAAQGVTSAAEVRDITAERMTYEARNHAQRLAQQYWEKYVLPFQN